jgi:hypothetical protein
VADTVDVAAGVYTALIATKDLGAAGHAQRIAVVEFETPAGDTLIVDTETVKGLKVVLAHKLAAGNGTDILDSISATGVVAHGVALDSDVELRPFLGGAAAVAFGATPTPVTAATLSHLIATRHGIPWMLGGHPNQITREFHITAAKTDADLLGAVAGTDKVVVTKLLVTVSKATTVNVGVRIGFAAATLPAAADAGTGAVGIVGSHAAIEPGFGFTTGDGSAPIGIGAAGEELRITSDAPTTGALRVVVTYFTVVES